MVKVCPVAGALRLSFKSTVALFPFAVTSLDRAFFSNETMDFNTGTSHEAQHLCVLVHGYVIFFVPKVDTANMAQIMGQPKPP